MKFSVCRLSCCSLSLCIGEISEANWKGFAVSSQSLPLMPNGKLQQFFAVPKELFLNLSFACFRYSFFKVLPQNVPLLSLGRIFAFLTGKIFVKFVSCGTPCPASVLQKEKAPHKIELRQRIVLTRFRTALGRFSVLTDPALLARLEIVSRYSVFNLSRRSLLPTIKLYSTPCRKSKNFIFHLEYKSVYSDS